MSLDIINQFRSAMAGRGIIPPAQIRADGQLHRCDSEGKNGKKDAAYVLHLNGLPAGGFENHRDGQGWQNWHAHINSNLSEAEKADYHAKLEVISQQRQDDKRRREKQGRATAQRLWTQAKPCSTHPYLNKKSVQAHGIKQLAANVQAGLSGQCLLIPIRDSRGELNSLQFIDESGEKRFVTGARKQGGYFSIGKPDKVLCIAEGFATAASIHQATGYAVAVAFDAGNLLAVARVLREKFPSITLLICADDDLNTPNNPGLNKARAAAQMVNGCVAVPDFGDTRPDKATDFNDLHQHSGLSTVRACIEAALQTSTPVPAKTIDNNKPLTCHYGTGYFELSQRGVLFHPENADKDSKPKPPVWLCSPLRIEAKTRDAHSNAWGRLLAWEDDDGITHTWAMPLSLLQGDGQDVRKELAGQGLSIAPGLATRNLLTAYLQMFPVDARARCVDSLGWHGSVYVTPDKAIGNSDERVVFQNAHAIEPGLSIKGDVAQWRKAIAARAAGNSRLMFALSTALAGPLLALGGEDSGGFHLRGASSSGKSTALKLAASVWGNPNRYGRLWRTTSNGLEGLAALHNDNTLILDELSQLDPKQAGEAAYLLANGQGKTRANRNGCARQSARWRVLFLSSGEQSLADLMTQAGKRTNAGQEIRLADIEADAGANMGLFEQLHGCASPAQFALELNQAANQYHGTAGMAWLNALVNEQSTLPSQIAQQVECFMQSLALPAHTQGQVHRVARRFALVATAGELATRYGLTGWNKGEAMKAAMTCFSAWLDTFGGTGNREQRAVLEQVTAFFEAHGNSRFESSHAPSEQRIANRVGFYRKNFATETMEYLVFPQAFKNELCQGIDHKLALRTLLAAGWIKPDKTGRPTQVIRVSGETPRRYYVFEHVTSEDENNDAIAENTTALAEVS